MTRARTLSRLGNTNVITATSSNNIGIGTTTPDAKLDVIGIVSATSFSGDGSQLTGIDSTALVDSEGTTRVQANTSGVNVTGVLTATSFSGDGTGLTGVASTDFIITGTAATFTSDVNIADSIIHVGDTDTKIRFPAADTFTVETAGSERVRVDSSGNLGVGTDTPGAILEIFHETSNTILNVKSGDAGAVLNLIDNSARSSIEQNGSTLKIISDTGAEDADSDIRLQVDGSTKMLINSSGDITPGADATQDLGATDKRFANIYSADLQLSNEGSSNDVDGTWGKYTIQEGEDDLFLINRRTGRKYKFNLTEVE